MKKVIFTVTLLAVMLVTYEKTSGQTTDDPTDTYNGIWAYSSGNLANLLTVNSNIKGALAKIRWSDLQDSTLQFNWTYFQTQLQLISNNNLEIGILIWVGPDAPSWIYNAPIMCQK